MDNKSEEQFILMQFTIANTKQDMKDKMKSITETLKVFIIFMIDQTNISKTLPTHKYALTPLEPITVVPTNRGLDHWKGGTLPKLVACLPSNIG